MKPRDREMLDRKFASSEIHKLPPQNIEAEQSVLGAMIIDNGKISAMREMLKNDDFYRDANSKIFAAILSLDEKQVAVDLVTLTEELKKRNQLDTCGGASYVCSIIDATVTAENIAYYAGIIKEKALRRKLIQNNTETITLAYADEEDLETLLATQQNMLFELFKRFVSQDGIQKLEATPQALKDYFSACRSTPFESLNQAIEGFMIGEFITIQGRTGMGKTALALNIIDHTAIKERCPAIYFGAQMSKQRIYGRLLAAKCKVPLRKILASRMKDEGKETLDKLAAVHELINSAPIYCKIISDKLSVPALIASIMNLVDNEMKNEPGLVIIENLQQLSWPGMENTASEQKKREEAERIRDALKKMSYDIKAPVIVSDQADRRVDEREDKRPGVADSKRGGKTEELADVIISLYRPNYYEKKKIEEPGHPEEAELIINKGGPSIRIPMTFFGEYLSWEEKETVP